MLKTSGRRLAKPKTDWYSTKVYLHFDAPLTRHAAKSFVENSDSVIKHDFLPLMAFDRIERRYRRAKGHSAPKISKKIRQLVYCSNRDGYVFSYYAQKLNAAYEDFIKNAGISENVIGYRKVGSNIELAASAFDEIALRGDCVALAFDISGFFDNIDHSVLKKNWSIILGEDSLPDDHFRVFRNLTAFRTVNRRACLRRLGFRPTARNSEIGRIPLCGIEEYRTKIRGDKTGLTNLVVKWKKKYRIPQGTPLSAIAANISMIDFDIFMREAILALGGSYRRYSDDILIIVPTSERNKVRPFLNNALRLTTKRLRVKDDKTHEIEFVAGGLATGRGTRPLQYLGFVFDGKDSFLRSSTIAKFYRRMFRAVSTAKRQWRKSRMLEIPGRKNLHIRKLLLKNTHLGPENFITSYAQRARRNLPNNKIAEQLSGHFGALQRRLEKTKSKYVPPKQSG